MDSNSHARSVKICTIYTCISSSLFHCVHVCTYTGIENCVCHMYAPTFKSFTPLVHDTQISAKATQPAQPNSDCAVVVKDLFHATDLASY